MRTLTAAGVTLATILFPFIAFADEGMWTFDNPPTAALQERYGFAPTQAWLEHVRLSSVRFNNGGSGSFVSPNGLIMTNHHVAVEAIQKVSTADKDYVELGFYAEDPSREVKIPDLELNVLQSMDDVTDRVRRTVRPEMSDVEALRARRAEIARIEKESLDQTGLRSDVVSLYHDGEFWLYRYKKYTDVRLVMAPERQAAYFGGDADNFTYPRYDLDVAFFRVYENDRPAPTPHYFKWSRGGASDGELVFVSGHPGSTDRLYTHAQLEYLRDYYYPIRLERIEREIGVLRNYAKRGVEQERRALVRVFYLENAKKALGGEYRGLLDPDLMASQRAKEQKFRERIAANPDWQQRYGDAWETITRVTAKRVEVVRERSYRTLAASTLSDFASTIVFYVTEVRKPDADRLKGYHDAELETTRYELLSPAPVYLDLEEEQLAGALELALDKLGPDDPFVKTALEGRTPAALAKEVIGGTRLADVAFRKSLLEGGEEVVAKSTDPLISLARRLAPLKRQALEWDKENIESVLSPASEKIAQARFAVYGKSVYPDATFTLRLAYGAVKGYPMNGSVAPYKTTLYGLYDRSLSFDGKGDFSLPDRYWQRREQLDLSTPVNFVTTTDIIGGNSGSPVINREAEVVGLIFDGNIESLVGRFVYEPDRNRAVAVHSSYIIEALRQLYGADRLADEVRGAVTQAGAASGQD